MVIPEAHIHSKAVITVRDVLPLVVPDVAVAKFRAARPDRKLCDALITLDESIVCM